MLSPPSINICPVGSGCRIHRLLHCGGIRQSTNECPGYNTKQSDGKVLVIPSLASLPGPLWPGVVEPDRVLSLSRIELNYILLIN